MFLRKTETDQVYLYVYVDNVLIFGVHRDKLQKISDNISNNFKVCIKQTVGKFLGIVGDIREY